MDLLTIIGFFLIFIAVDYKRCEKCKIKILSLEYVIQTSLRVFGVIMILNSK